MGRNLEKDAIEIAAKNRRILENGFRIFSEKTIEKVTMADVAKAAGIGIASLYRYYSTKQELVMGVSTWMWSEYMKAALQRAEESRRSGATAAEEFDFYLESFLDLYRNHKDMLRFNQFFNIYLQSEDISEEGKKPYMDLIFTLQQRFRETYLRGQRDGTLRTDLTEEKMFALSLHLMLAAVTRYAVGLVYGEAHDAEEELRLLKEMLLLRFIRDQEREKDGQEPSLAICT